MTIDPHRRVAARRFRLTTPEHVEIDFALADLGNRFGALALDLGIQILLLFALLTTEQIFARNLTRDLEIFLPLTLLPAPRDLVPGAPGWVQLATAVWILAVGLLPFFNRWPPSERKDKTLAGIAEKVADKIGWDLDESPVSPRPFLQAFYAAQRGRLEQKMLFGKRQEKKVQ